MTGITAFTAAETGGYGEFRDAANPRALDDWDGPVQGYVNHTPAWSRADFQRHHEAGWMATSVQPESHWADVAREIDVEANAAGAAAVPGFVLKREHLGLRHAGCYVDLNGWPAVRGQLEAARIDNTRCRIRIADWTGTPRRFGPAQLGDGWEAWAHQFENVEEFGFDRNWAWQIPKWAH